jgi:outer membrane protein TolC
MRGEKTVMRHSLQSIVCAWLAFLFATTALAAATEEKVLDLESAVRIALDTNPLNRAAREGVSAAVQAVGEARAPYYPELGLKAGYSRWERHAFLPSGVLRPEISSTIGPVTDWSAGLVSRYTLFDFGQRRAELASARAKQSATEYDSERVRQDIALAVHEAYFRLAAALEAEAVARRALERAEDHLRLARTRKEAGAVPQADVMRAQVEVADAKLALERAAGTVRVARGDLNTAMGLPVEMQVQIEVTAREFAPPNQIDVIRALDEAVAARPELKAAAQRVAAAGRGVDMVKSTFGPRVRAEAAYGWRDTTFFPNDKDWAVGATVELPLFTGFARKHKLAGAKAEASRQKAEEERLVQTVRQQVWSAYSKLRENYEAALSTEVLLKDAHESLRLANERYKAGAGTITDLLDTETALARAEATRVNALWEYQVARSAFQRSVGNLASEAKP